MGISGVPLDKEQIIQMFHKKGGIITHTADALGCQAKTLYNWVEKDEEIATALKEAREASAKEKIDRNLVLLEKAYKSAETNLEKFDVTTTIFILNTLGKFKEPTISSGVNIIHIDKPYTQETND